jgi:uncharacterized membrane protein
MNILIGQIIIVVLAIVGLYLSWKINRVKARGAKTGQLVCPIGTSCKHILFSKFSAIFGVSIEILGFIYYGLILLGYLIMIFYPLPALALILLLATFAGFAFSIYLLFVQGFLIKKWCVWCVSSALSSILIFGATLFNLEASFAAMDVSPALLIISNLSIIAWLQFVGIVLGLSSALISGLMTIKFLKDFQIDEYEDRKITIATNVTWLALLIVLTSNFCLYIVSPLLFLSSPLLTMQMIILIIIVLIQAVLDLYISPKLIGIRLDLGAINIPRTFWLRQYALAFGTVSLVSWILLAILTYFDVYKNSDLAVMMSYYIAIVFVVLTISQLAILILDKKKYAV